MRRFRTFGDTREICRVRLPQSALFLFCVGSLALRATTPQKTPNSSRVRWRSLALMSISSSAHNVCSRLPNGIPRFSQKARFSCSATSRARCREASRAFGKA